jgi:hypothetical protein
VSKDKIIDLSLQRELLGSFEVLPEVENSKFIMGLFRIFI